MSAMWHVRDLCKPYCQKAITYLPGALALGQYRHNGIQGPGAHYTQLALRSALVSVYCLSILSIASLSSIAKPE